MEQRIRAALLSIAAVPGAIYLFVFDPSVPGHFPPCPTRFLTGLLCPGCGSLRALHEILHLRLASAYDFNPLAIVLLPLLCWTVIWSAWFAVSGRQLWRPAFGGKFPMTFLVLILAFAVVRNFPS